MTETAAIAETAATATETTATEAAPPPPAPEPTGPSRVEVERAKLDALLARSAERKAKLAEREKQLGEREARIPKPEAYRENPIAALEQMGLTPVEALDALVSHTNREGTELGKVERELREHLKALEARASEAERIAKELAAERAAEREERERTSVAEQARRAEDAMIEHLKGETYGDLATFYERGELIASANYIADALHAQGKRVTFEEVGRQMLDLHRKSIARYRAAGDTSSTQSAPGTAPKSPKTLSSDLATVAATSAPRNEPWEERVKRIAARESRR